MARSDAELRPVIDVLVQKALADPYRPREEDASHIVAMCRRMARALDDAGLLEEEHFCAAIGCTEPAEMGFLTCKTHREVD